jgi:hypothetical protein
MTKWNSPPTKTPDPSSCSFPLPADCQVCRSDTRTITITVLPKPTATLRIAQGAGYVTSTTICAGETRNLNLTGFSSDAAGHVIKIDWKNTTNSTNGQIDPITITDAASQNISLTGAAVATGVTEYWISEIGKGDCDPITIDEADAVKVTITRRALLDLTGYNINGAETVCEGTTTVLYSIFPPHTKPVDTEYIWYYDGPPPVAGETANSITLDFTGSLVGTTHTLQVGLKYTTAPACESNLIPAGYKRITITARPSATYSPAARNICEGENVTIPIELTGNPAAGDGSNDWKVTWQLIEDKWADEISCPKGVKDPYNIDAKVNSAYVVMGLLYGAKDMERTLEISTRCGADSDCNPATAAGILGTMLGYSNIDAKWIDQIKQVEDLNFDHTDISLNKVYKLGFNQALEMIKRGGGEVSDNEVTIVVQKPKPVKLEQSFEGLELVKKEKFPNRSLRKPFTYEFTGTGFVCSGRVRPQSGDYVAEIEVDIDGKKEVIKMPADFITRRFDIYWNYELPKGEHKVTMTWLNPEPEYNITIDDVLTYTTK